MSQPPSGGNSRSSNNDSFNTVNSFGSVGERSEILTWISPLELRVQHHDIRAYKVGDVGDWLLPQRNIGIGQVDLQ